MKQQITRKQWQELTLGEQRKYQETLGHGSFPTIGDMIEFLDKGPEEDCPGTHTSPKERHSEEWLPWRINNSVVMHWDGELCDELWRAVKEVLTKEV